MLRTKTLALLMAFTAAREAGSQPKRSVTEMAIFSHNYMMTTTPLTGKTTYALTETPGRVAVQRGEADDGAVMFYDFNAEKTVLRRIGYKDDEQPFTTARNGEIREVAANAMCVVESMKTFHAQALSPDVLAGHETILNNVLRPASVRNEFHHN